MRTKIARLLTLCRSESGECHDNVTNDQLSLINLVFKTAGQLQLTNRDIQSGNDGASPKDVKHDSHMSHAMSEVHDHRKTENGTERGTMNASTKKAINDFSSMLKSDGTLDIPNVYGDKKHCGLKPQAKAPHSDIPYQRFDKHKYVDAFKHHKIVGVPDDHESIHNKKAFADSLKDLKAAGGTAVGFELLPKNMQRTLDDFASNLKAQAKGNHSFDGTIEAQRSQITKAFDGATGDPNANSENARALEQIVEKAATLGLKPLALDTNIKEEFHDGHGFNSLRDAIKAIPSEHAQAFSTYLDSKSTPEQRKDAKAEIEAGLKGKECSGDNSELFKTMDGMRQSNPPVNAKSFGAAIDAYKRGDNGPMGAVIQDYRNSTFAKVIRDYEKETPGAHVAVFAGYGHIFQPSKEVKPLSAYPGMDIAPIQRQGIDAKNS
jgi:hypothetical protein